MSVYAVVNESEPMFLASVAGWSEVAEWSEEVDVDGHEAFFHLIEHGYTEQIEQAAAECRKAIEANPPSDDIRKTLDILLELMDGETGVFFITDGMSASQ